MTSWFQNDARQEHLNAVCWLLQPLEAHWGEAVKKTLAALRNGAQVSKAGEVLAADLLAWQANFRREGETRSAACAEENERLRQKCFELEQDNRGLAARNRKLEAEHQSLTEQNEKQAQEIEDLKYTLTAQNEVLAEQYYKLANIFGHSNNSTPA